MTSECGINAFKDNAELLSIVDELLELSARKNEERVGRKATDDDTYNIFDALSLTTNEVNGHSRFLQHLLSPRDSHGMNDAFLQSFFEQMPKLEARPWLADARVRREVSFEDGRLDILIELPDTCCVVIEVKIYATDQYRQLERYSNYIKKWETLNPNASVVQEFYLTLDRHKPSDFSVGKTDIDYTCISFKDNILPWLENCIELAASKPRVSEAIKQYVEVIKSLTREAEMDKELSCIADVVQSSQKNYEAATQIETSLLTVRTEMLKKVFGNIELYLKERFPEACYLTTDAERADIAKYYERDERRKPWPRLKFKLKENDDRILALAAELNRRLYIGLIFFKDGENEWGLERIDNERDWLYTLSSNGAEEWKPMVDEAPAGDWWLDWSFLETQTNEPEDCIDFKHCTSKEYSELFNPEMYDAFIQRIYNGIDSYLIRLKDLGLYEPA